MMGFTKFKFRARVKGIGQDLAEYALLIGLIALVLVLAVTIIGQSFSGLFSTLASMIDNWW